MQKRIKLDTKISDLVRSTIYDRKENSGLNDPVPHLCLGHWNDEKEESYALGMYERHLIPDDNEGKFIIMDGIEFYIIQERLCVELNNKKIDVVNGYLAVLEME